MNTFRRLGFGGFGCVYEGLDLEGGQLVALKHLGKHNDTFEREVSLLSKLSHPNVVCYLDSFSDASSSWIVMELCAGGSLSCLLKRIYVLPVGIVRKYLKGILHGLAYLHRNHIVHCDLKPANILLTPNGIPKLSDFGLSRGQSQKSADASSCGSLRYMPPEGITGTAAADVWALGITVLELLDGADTQFSCNAKGEPLPEWLPETAKDFLRHCLVADPSQRWTCQELLQHQFIRQECADPVLRKPHAPHTTIGHLQRIMDLPDRNTGTLKVGVPEKIECLPGQVMQCHLDASPIDGLFQKRCRL
eukprot:GGOE01005249.1.p1 GENE.GGOE01005249.1~~GGOE01005249.1.p1  ORF type:complete len:342 (-),score=32.90 GGOE01005249.1:740-1654(-)